MAFVELKPGNRHYKHRLGRFLLADQKIMERDGPILPNDPSQRTITIETEYVRIFPQALALDLRNKAAGRQRATLEDFITCFRSPRATDSGSVVRTCFYETAHKIPDSDALTVFQEILVPEPDVVSALV